MYEPVTAFSRIRIEEMLAAINTLCDFVHETQLERGLASLYLRSTNSEFAESLERQFALVDNLLEQVRTIPLSKSSHFTAFGNSIQYLTTKRKYIVSRQISPSDALLFYSRDIISPAIEIVQDMAIFDKENFPARVSSLINFLQWKERVGLERALGTHLVSLESNEVSELKDRLAYIIQEQHAYERMFMALADDHCRTAIEKLEKTNEIFQKIELINQSLSKGNHAQIAHEISAKEWFRLFSAKMDLLHEVGKSIAKNLSLKANIAQHSPKLENKQTQNASRDMLDKSLREKYDFIAKLPLFTGIGEAELSSLMKHARISQYSKGNLIFMQGEQATRFHIVLDGWVKLFKGDIDGQESILQVVHRGEALLESVLVKDAVFPVSAQAVENVTLISIPATILREEMQNNKFLAINMLATIAGRSQELISQFEQLTLKSVTQRVGWFLLKLFIEDGEKSNSLKLPYDKALIAGYLGMKPETFSRTLQTLRDQGISSEQSTITLRNALKLCDFCDVELSASCKRKGTKACKNLDCQIWA